jgi:hypothetical protein
LRDCGAGNPHATFCGNRGRVTASGDPVVPSTGHPYRNQPVARQPATGRAFQGSRKAWMPLPLPSVVVPDPTNSIRPTGVAPELTDPGMAKVRSNAPEFSS